MASHSTGRAMACRENMRRDSGALSPVSNSIADATATPGWIHSNPNFLGVPLDPNASLARPSWAALSMASFVRDSFDPVGRSAYQRPLDIMRRDECVVIVFFREVDLCSGRGRGPDRADRPDTVA